MSEAEQRDAVQPLVLSTDPTTMAFQGGDTSPLTQTDIGSRNTALQTQHDALKAAAATFETARQTYLTALHTAEVAVPASLKSGSGHKPAV